MSSGFAAISVDDHPSVCREAQEPRVRERPPERLDLRVSLERRVEIALQVEVQAERQVRESKPIPARGLRQELDRPAGVPDPLAGRARPVGAEGQHIVALPHDHLVADSTGGLDGPGGRVPCADLIPEVGVRERDAEMVRAEELGSVELGDAVGLREEERQDVAEPPEHRERQGLAEQHVEAPLLARR
jgi:hypothetical protein